MVLKACWISSDHDSEVVSRPDALRFIQATLQIAPPPEAVSHVRPRAELSTKTALYALKLRGYLARDAVSWGRPFSRAELAHVLYIYVEQNYFENS